MEEREYFDEYIINSVHNCRPFYTKNIDRFNEEILLCKKYIIAQNIRRESKSLGKRKCFVCGGTSNLQNHHIIKVEWIALYIIENLMYRVPSPDTIQIEKLPIPRVDLCNLDHRIFHHIIGDIDFIDQEIYQIELFDDVKDKFVEIITSVNFDQYKDKYWYDSYNSLWLEKESNMLENLDKYLEEKRVIGRIEEAIQDEPLWEGNVL